MHISEGVLSIPVLATGWVVTVALLSVSLRRVRSRMLPRMAVFASAFFLASLVRVPIGAGSAHFALLGLLGMTLGWGAFVAIFISLALQALLFQFGGLVSLGVNACVMGIPALCAYGLLGRVVGLPGLKGSIAGFLAGFVPIVLGVTLAYASLVLSNAALGSTATIFAVANLPLAVLEGVVTLFAVVFLRKVAPDMLASSDQDAVALAGAGHVFS